VEIVPGRQKKRRKKKKKKTEIFWEASAYNWRIGFVGIGAKGGGKENEGHKRKINV